MKRILTIAALVLLSNAAFAEVPIAKPSVLSVRNVLDMLDSSNIADQNLAKGVIWGVSMGDPRACTSGSGTYVINSTAAMLQELVRRYPDLDKREAFGCIEMVEEKIWACK
jgi:hypothetical protein